MEGVRTVRKRGGGDEELLFDDGLTFERGARRRKAQWDFFKRERRSCELVGRVERGER